MSLCLQCVSRLALRWIGRVTFGDLVVEFALWVVLVLLLWLWKMVVVEAV